MVQLLALTCMVAVLISGCASFPSWPNPPANEPKPSYQKTEWERANPRQVSFKLPTGEEITAQVLYDYERSYAVNATPPETRWSFWGWLLNPFASWWLWLLLAFVIFVPGGFGLVQFGAGRVRRRMGQVVAGVEDYLRSSGNGEAEKLKSSLSAKMDKDAKLEVSKIKGN